MRTLQGGFPRLKDRFIFENMGKQKQLVHLVVLLSNLQARKVVIGQICTVYKAHLDRDLRTMFPPCNRD